MRRTRVISIVILAWLCVGLFLFLAKSNVFFGDAPTFTPPTQPHTSPPDRLYVPRLGIDAAIVPVGKDRQGRMESPADPDEVGWYAFGAYPGLPGRAVFAGHYNTEYNTPAIFANLQDLQVGDLIEVEDASGKILDFRVEHTQLFPVAESPLEAIFGPGSLRELRLITCAGEWNEDTYTERFVVFAQLVP